MEQLKSTPAEWIGKEFTGFVINVVFSPENEQVINAWLDGLREASPEGLYTMSPESLHITVLDWIAPLYDYDGTDKHALFDKLRLDYDAAFRRVTRTMTSFDIHFDEIRVTPGTIILTGRDGGQFESLRSQFMNSVILPKGGKQPPDIIHSSLARFVMPEIELLPVKAYVADNPLKFTQHINEFRLVETRREPMQDFSVLEVYELRPSV